MLICSVSTVVANGQAELRFLYHSSCLSPSELVHSYTPLFKEFPSGYHFFPAAYKKILFQQRFRIVERYFCRLSGYIRPCRFNSTQSSFFSCPYFLLFNIFLFFLFLLQLQTKRQPKKVCAECATISECERALDTFCFSVLLHT